MANQIVFHCTLDPRPKELGFEVERLLTAASPEQAKELYLQMLGEEHIPAQPQDVVVTETDLPAGSERGMADSEEETTSHYPVTQAVADLQAINPDAKIETRFLGFLEGQQEGYGISVLAPSANLSCVFRQPGLTVLDVTTKRTGRFARTHLVLLVGEAPEVTPEEEQHRGICQRLDVDALLIVGVKRPGAHRPEQGEQTLIGSENTGLSLGEMHGITARLMNDVNSAYMAEQQFPPFPFASATGQSGGKLIAPKPKSIITSIN